MAEKKNPIKYIISFENICNRVYDTMSINQQTLEEFLEQLLDELAEYHRQ